MCLWWLCPASHQTEVSFFSRLCHWRRFPAKPVHPRAPSLPEITQPISYPGAETWGWTKHAFSNLKALVCMSLKTWVDGVLSRPFLLVYPPTDFVCCYFSYYFKELGVNWNLAVVTLTSRGRKNAPAILLLVTWLTKYRSRNGGAFQSQGWVLSKQAECLRSTNGELKCCRLCKGWKLQFFLCWDCSSLVYVFNCF